MSSRAAMLLNPRAYQKEHKQAHRNGNIYLKPFSLASSEDISSPAPHLSFKERLILRLPMLNGDG